MRVTDELQESRVGLRQRDDHGRMALSGVQRVDAETRSRSVVRCGQTRREYELRAEVNGQSSTMRNDARMEGRGEGVEVEEDQVEVMRERIGLACEEESLAS